MSEVPSVALVLDSRQQRARFGRYAGEILRAEGIGDVQEVELAGVSGAELERFGVVVLAGTGAVPGLPELLAAHVEAGGRLLLIRPSAELAPLAGLRPLYRAAPDAALLVEPHGTALGGFPYEPLQVAGPLDLYHPESGTTVLARAVAGRWPVGSHPAIVERVAGSGGGGGAGERADLPVRPAAHGGPAAPGRPSPGRA